MSVPKRAQHRERPTRRGSEKLRPRSRTVSPPSSTPSCGSNDSRRGRSAEARGRERCVRAGPRSDGGERSYRPPPPHPAWLRPSPAPPSANPALHPHPARQRAPNALSRRLPSASVSSSSSSASSSSYPPHGLSPPQIRPRSHFPRRHHPRRRHRPPRRLRGSSRRPLDWHRRTLPPPCALRAESQGETRALRMRRRSAVAVAGKGACGAAHDSLVGHTRRNPGCRREGRSIASGFRLPSRRWVRWPPPAAGRAEIGGRDGGK